VRPHWGRLRRAKSPAVRPDLRTRRSRGQALAEFAIVVPLFFVMSVAALDMGRVVWAMDITANAAREAARWAIVHGGAPATLCPVGPPSADATIPSASGSCPYPSPSTQSIKDLAINRAVGAGGTVTVEVCYYNPATTSSCSGNTSGTGATNARGMVVTVHVFTSLDLISSTLFQRVAFMLGNNGIPSTYAVSATSTMLVNN
jgi:Flp pilus assembly protein TadG